MEKSHAELNSNGHAWDGLLQFEQNRTMLCTFRPCQLRSGVGSRWYRAPCYVARVRRFAVIALAGSAMACDPSRPPRVFPPEGCPQLPPVVAADTSCDARPCLASVTQAGCEVSITLSRCRTTALSATLDAQGILQFKGTGGLGTCVGLAAQEGMAASFRCDGAPHTCRYDLYPRAPALTAMVQRRTLVPGTITSTQVEDSGLLQDYSALAGSINSFLLTPDDVFAVLGDPRHPERRCAFGTSPSTLVRIPRATWPEGQIRSSSAPPCLYQLLANPALPGELVGFTGGRQPQVLRFRESGAYAVTATLTLASTSTDAFVPVASFASPDGALRVVYTNRRATTYLVRLEAQSLSVLEALEIRPPPPAQPGSKQYPRVRSAAVSGGILYLADIRNGLLFPVSLDTSAVQPFQVLSDEARDMELADGPATIVDTRDDALLVTSSGYFRPIEGATDPADLGQSELGGIWLIKKRGDGSGRTALYYHDIATPFGALALAERPQRFLVGLTRHPSFEAFLALFATDEGRFLPGELPVGYGPIRELSEDHGEIFGVLPWAGEIFRVSGLP